MSDVVEMLMQDRGALVVGDDGQAQSVSPHVAQSPAPARDT
jgi:hypothetical protein